MRFWERQREARRSTRWLLLVFGLCAGRRSVGAPGADAGLVAGRYAFWWLGLPRGICRREYRRDAAYWCWAAAGLSLINYATAERKLAVRVLIMPTAPIKSFIQKQIYLESTSAATFYVAATRAKQSLAIIIDKPGSSKLPVWAP